MPKKPKDPKSPAALLAKMRAAKLSPERRAEIARMGGKARWSKARRK